MKFYNKISAYFKLQTGSHLRVYDGFGNHNKASINGHALKLSPIPRKHFSQNFFINTLALLRMFMVVPKEGARIRLDWEGRSYYTHSEKDGYFRIEFPLANELEPGDHVVNIYMYHTRSRKISYETEAVIRIPERNLFYFISDIDDTFLISHSETKLKRLYVLLTENAYSRRPFDGVVRHYQFLQYAQTTAHDPNPFFYVSSSEWNLYFYIKDFILKNELPRGMFLLNQLKTFNKLLQTGQNNHGSKFMRIVRIIEAYPEQQFILLGDNSQQDPHIYKAITDHFPEKIKAVYIRNVSKKNKQKVIEDLDVIASKGIAVCYFKHSADAIAHSKSVGLISGEL